MNLNCSKLKQYTLHFSYEKYLDRVSLDLGHCMYTKNETKFQNYIFDLSLLQAIVFLCAVAMSQAQFFYPNFYNGGSAPVVANG